MTEATSQTAPVYDANAVAHLINVRFGNAELANFGNLPLAINGFITFFDPGLSIVELRARVDSKLFYPQDWYNSEPFAKLEGPPCYRQVRMQAVKNSFGKTFVEQQALVAPDEEIPTARVVLMGMAIHFLATVDRHFPADYVRCVDWDSDGGRVGVGGFGSGGFFVGSGLDDDRNGLLGLASSRKF
jgi:hypothetical protein